VNGEILTNGQMTISMTNSTPVVR